MNNFNSFCFFVLSISAFIMALSKVSTYIEFNIFQNKGSSSIPLSVDWTEVLLIRDLKQLLYSEQLFPLQKDFKNDSIFLVPYTDSDTTISQKELENLYEVKYPNGNEEIVVFDDLDFDSIFKDSITHADAKNGIFWKGTIEVKYPVFRSIVFEGLPKVKKGIWKDSNFTLSLDVQNSDVLGLTAKARLSDSIFSSIKKINVTNYKNPRTERLGS